MYGWRPDFRNIRVVLVEDHVELTPPYMHDGSLKTLEEVVEHYDKGGTANEWLSKDIKKLGLTDQEKKDLVAFMKATTGPLPPVEQGRLP